MWNSSYFYWEIAVDVFSVTFTLCKVIPRAGWTLRRVGSGLRAACWHPWCRRKRAGCSSTVWIKDEWCAAAQGDAVWTRGQLQTNMELHVDSRDPLVLPCDLWYGNEENWFSLCTKSIQPNQHLHIRTGWNSQQTLCFLSFSEKSGNIWTGLFTNLKLFLDMFPSLLQHTAETETLWWHLLSAFTSPHPLLYGAAVGEYMNVLLPRAPPTCMHWITDPSC